MALPRKIAAPQSSTLSGQIPTPAQIPPDVQDRFESMKAWQEEMDRFWNRFGDLLQRDLDQISEKFKADEDAVAAFQASATATLSTLTAQVAQLLAAPVVPPQIAVLTSQLQALTAALAAHIASTVTHGTSGDIVGTTDAQDLDSKRIGLSVPLFGRFQPSVGSGVIPAGQTAYVGPTDYMVVAGPLTVTGQLTIAGTVLVM